MIQVVMRMPRIKIEGRSAVYHCISRVVGGQFLLGTREREKLRRMLWQQADFSGVEIITYCVLSNHFHVLVRVPAEREIADEELVRRTLRFYGSSSPFAQTVGRVYREHGRLTGNLRKVLRGRMGDVSLFMKELKQRFSKWYNRATARFGTLWAERFKSVLVEEQSGVMRTVAAYIDLNSVRAGIVKDPKEYRWCGYAEAAAGGERARSGIMRVQEGANWKEISREYRAVLLLRADVPGHSEQQVLDRASIRRALERNAELALGQVLRLRIRYMCDGVVLGSEAYVDEVFDAFRSRFGRRRRRGARPIRGVGLGGMRTLRDLRVSVVG